MSANRIISAPNYYQWAESHVLAEGETFGMSRALMFDDEHVFYTVERMYELLQMPRETLQQARDAERDIWPYVEMSGNGTQPTATRESAAAQSMRRALHSSI